MSIERPDNSPIFQKKKKKEKLIGRAHKSDYPSNKCRPTERQQQGNQIESKNSSTNLLII